MAYLARSLCSYTALGNRSCAMFLFFPAPLVYTDLSKVEMENPFKDPRTALSGQEGCNTEMESADCMPNATRLFLPIENKINRYINCSHIWKWKVLTSSFTMFSFFLFIILFLGLSWGFYYNFTLLNMSSSKALSQVCLHILNVIQYFMQKLPWP